MTAVDNIDLAVAEHEACPDCSRPGRIVWHYLDSVCPFRRRERSVPCRGSSLAESMAGLHRTWNDDAVCDACAAKNAAVVAQLKAQRS